MKKLFANPFVDNIVKGLTLLGVTAILYFVMDTRDFRVYEQPARDGEQDRSILMLSKDIKTRDSLWIEKFANINSRTDTNKDAWVEIKEEVTDIKIGVAVLLKHSERANREFEEIKRTLEDKEIANK